MPKIIILIGQLLCFRLYDGNENNYFRYLERILQF